MPITGATASSSPRRNPQPETSHSVRRGETLASIARQHGVELQALLDANPQLRDPDRLRVGQRLQLPDSGTQGSNSAAAVAQPVEDRFYTVARGDSLARIAASHGIGVDALLAANPQIQDPDALQPDDRLRLPSGAGGRGALGALNAHARFNSVGGTGLPAPSSTADGVVKYEPRSAEAIQLFTQAAGLAGVPASWAREPGLHNILSRESQGRVGVPNYTYGRRGDNPANWPAIHAELRGGRIRARSSATGLGQLKLDNVDRFYPNGRAGIGDPLQEAAGMLAYIKDRYGTPARAWQLYGVRHEGY